MLNVRATSVCRGEDGERTHNESYDKKGGRSSKLSAAFRLFFKDYFGGNLVPGWAFRPPVVGEDHYHKPDEQKQEDAGDDGKLSHWGGVLSRAKCVH